MHEIIKYFFSRFKSMGKINSVKWDSWNEGKIPITVEFFPVIVHGNSVFIPTGTKEMPYGISNISDCFLLFIVNGMPDRFIYIEEIKRFLKNNKEISEWSKGEDKKYGYKIPYNLIREYHDTLIYKL